MILERLRLQRFGRFLDDQFQFSPGLNVVRGLNEAGKSTIREAIVRLLFDSTAVDTNARKFLRYTTWGQDQDSVLGAAFAIGDDRWEIQKDFDRDEILLAAVDGSEELHDSALICERLQDLLGLLLTAAVDEHVVRVPLELDVRIVPRQTVIERVMQKEVC